VRGVFGTHHERTTNEAGAFRRLPAPYPSNCLKSVAMQTVTEIDDGIYTIAGVLTPPECQSLIERAEAIGFEPASVRTKKTPGTFEMVIDPVNHILYSASWEEGLLAIKLAE
jgi:hypothetical protein